VFASLVVVLHPSANIPGRVEMEGLLPPLNSLWDSDHSASLWFGLVWFCAVPFPGALPSLPLTLGWAWQRRGQISAISVWNHLGEGLSS
jgi:hypothetical protein